MKSTIHYKKWDIILVPFPFTDLSAFKKRPALVVSPDQYNMGIDIVIAFITSKTGLKARAGDYPIQEWEKARLPKPSMIRMKFATINKNIVVKQLGKLTDKDIGCFKNELINFFTQ